MKAAITPKPVRFALAAAIATAAVTGLFAAGLPAAAAAEVPGEPITRTIPTAELPARSALTADLPADTANWSTVELSEDGKGIAADPNVLSDWNLVRVLYLADTSTLGEDVEWSVVSATPLEETADSQEGS